MCVFGLKYFLPYILSNYAYGVVYGLILLHLHNFFLSNYAVVCALGISHFLQHILSNYVIVCGFRLLHVLSYSRSIRFTLYTDQETLPCEPLLLLHTVTSNYYHFASPRQPAVLTPQPWRPSRPPVTLTRRTGHLPPRGNLQLDTHLEREKNDSPLMHRTTAAFPWGRVQGATPLCGASTCLMPPYLSAPQ